MRGLPSSRDHRRHRAGLRAARSSSARARAARRRRLLGRVVRPVPRARAGAREGGRRARGQGRARQARHRRQPAHRRRPSASRASPPSRRSRTARVVDEFVGAQPPAAGRALLRRAACPPRPTRSSAAGDEASLRRALELEPGRADAARRAGAPAAPTAASATRRWRCSPTSPAPSPPTAWPRACGSSRPTTSSSPRRSPRSTPATPSAALDAADRRDRRAPTAHKDDLRRVVVGVLDELGVEHPLARDSRRRLAAALY